MPRGKRSRTGSMVKETGKRRKTKDISKSVPDKKYPDPVLNPRYGSITGLAVGFPEKLKFKHRYVGQYQFATAGGITTNFVIRANGMYDPDATQTGHQPTYYDYLTGIYNHWYVVSSRIKWTFVPVGTAAQVPYRITCLIDDDATYVGNVDEGGEQKHAQTRICGGGINPTKEVVYQYYNSQDLWGNNVLANSRQRGSASADPSEQTYFLARISPMDGSTNMSVYAVAEVEYTAVWLELQEIASS